jgi:hypothetical protein
MGFYIVGVTQSCQRLAVTNTLLDAEKYISTLPYCEQGIYYIDGPCTEIVELRKPMIRDYHPVIRATLGEPRNA